MEFYRNLRFYVVEYTTENGEKSSKAYPSAAEAEKAKKALDDLGLFGGEIVERFERVKVLVLE